MRKDDQLSARRRGDQHVPSGSLSALEKAGIEAALNRCRALAQQIEGDLRVRRSERFADLVSLAELQAALERAAWVLERRSRQSVQSVIVVEDAVEKHANKKPRVADRCIARGC
jgi:hypothetical protein